MIFDQRQRIVKQMMICNLEWLIFRDIEENEKKEQNKNKH